MKMLFDSSRYKLRTRILISTLSVVLLSALVIGASVLWNYSQLTRHDLESRVAIEAKIISGNVAASVLFNDNATALEILSTFSADPAVLKAELQTLDNEVFAEYTSEKLSQEMNNAFVLQTDILFENNSLGTLSLTVSRKELKDQNISIIIFLTIVLLAVVFIAFLLSTPLIKSVLNPLLNLHKTSQEIAQTRNYSLRAQVKSTDEVGRLSEMFNRMVEQIEHRDDMLEKQVGQRTNELEKLAEEFRFRAFHDSLTGLPNRALLNERFEHSVDHTVGCKNRFACLLLDLDDFKAINDTKGHEFGDELLIEVASRLKTTIRAEDFVCRIGGDEFIILLNDLVELHDVDMVAKKILAQLNRAFVIKGEQVRTAVSIGGAVFPDHGCDSSAIKRHADVAMYRAKDAGKNQFCLFSEGMQDDVKYRMMILSDMRPALDSGQFEVYVQPKMNPFEQDIVGCEALIRWNHPKEGFLTPNKFIPYAEEIGLISEIDYFVIRDCCKKISEWNMIFTQPIPIACNLSGRHFHDFKIVDVLQNALTEFRVNPSQLEVEITEAVLIEDPKKAQKIVHAIKSLGIGVSLDDFGTGYSSLNYLRTLPIDTVKLDRSFVSNIDTNVQDKRLTRGIVSLAKGLNLKLVAEGVETEVQMQTLMELGCHTMQGYYFLPPVPAAEFLHWYLKNHALRIALQKNY